LKRTELLKYGEEPSLDFVETLGFLAVLFLSFIGKLKRNDIGDESSLERGGRFL
jgi:hypothetical protein